MSSDLFDFGARKKKGKSKYDLATLLQEDEEGTEREIKGSPPKEAISGTENEIATQRRGKSSRAPILGEGGRRAEKNIEGVSDGSAAPETPEAVAILEEGREYRVTLRKGEETPTYHVNFPILNGEDRDLLKKLTDRAIREIDIDPETFLQEEEKKAAFRSEVMALIEREFPELPQEKKEQFTERAVMDMVGYGLLDPLLADDALEEVMVVGIGKPVYVYHRKHGMCKTNIVFEEDQEIGNIIDRIARSVGRRVDIRSPLLDARLPDGSRVNATVRPVSLDGPSLTIRKFREDPFTITDLFHFGTLNDEVAAFLWLAVDGYAVKPANILVSGGTGSGKTTTLNCLASFIPPTDRVLTIEDTAELQLPLTHWIRLETRPPNVEGKGEVSMDMLLKNTLRMRPDRIIVGEVRGGEARTLLAAMNTGQNGCMGTLHANTAKETITRLINPPMSVPKVMIPSLHLILMQNRFTHEGKTVRRVTEIAEVEGIDKGEVQLNVIYRWDPKDDQIKPTGFPSVIKAELARLRGLSLKEIEDELERRKKVLRVLREKNVRGLRAVGEVIQRYALDSAGFSAKMKGAETGLRIPGPGKGREAPERGTKRRDRRAYSFLEKVLGRLPMETPKEKRKRKVVDERENRLLVVEEGEVNPLYVVPLYDLTAKEQVLLRSLEKKAINEIEVDPSSIEKEVAWKFFYQEVLRIVEREGRKIPPEKRTTYANIIVHNMIGYGCLDYLLGDDELEEIMVIGDGRPIYVNHRRFGTLKTNIHLRDGEALRTIEKIASSVERRIDKASPLLDARLPDGSRVNATIPPISIDGPTITIRKFKADPYTVTDLIRFRTLNTEVAAFLWVAVEGLGIKPGNILVAGGSGSGKTTTLNTLSSFIPTTARVVTIEDTAEIHLPIEHCIRLETRPPNVEGEGEVSMEDLVKNTLRMRPDRIIVGEVRGGEAKTLFTAMNTGHDGCMGTVHSNSAEETIVRLTNPPMDVPYIMLPALDLILMQKKIFHEGTSLRRITEVAESAGLDGQHLVLNTVYSWDPKTDEILGTGSPSLLLKKVGKLRGWVEKEVNQERRRREKILSWMVQKDISDLTDVMAIVERYYTEPEDLMREVETDLSGAS
jgi:flagellar protein FlaI